MQEDLISDACKAAEEGMFVFPVRVHPDTERPGKNKKDPLCASWTRQSTDDPELVVRFDWSRATNFGIDCEKSGIWVVDIDDRAALASVPLTMTRIQETVSGGLHYIYKAHQTLDQRNTTGSPAKGVDIRANGGFIVWYGAGEMAGDTVQPWPFKTVIGKHRDARAASSSYEPGHIPPGGRNNDAISAAGYFMGRYPGATLEILFEYLVGHSAIYHAPPLSVDELRKIAASAQRWREEAGEIEKEEFFGGFGDIPYIDPPVSYCGNWLRAGSLSMVYSRAGIGKTAWLSDLVFSVHRGEQFMGMETIKAKRILWINGDMPMWQISERLGHLDGSADLWHVMFDDLMMRAQELADRCRGYDIVVMDNRPALFDLGDANAAEAWKPLMVLLRVIANSGPAVLVATHEGKGEGTSSFGSSAQEWSIDNNVRISNRVPTEKEEKDYEYMCHHLPTRKVEWTKHRMSEMPPSREFFLRKLLSPADANRQRIVCEWSCFYDASGKPLVKKNSSGKA